MPIFFAQVNDATVRLLAANGFEVITLHAALLWSATCTCR
jgi:hypothetical protein